MDRIRRVALVSGGSRGIGRATVLRLVRDGYQVAFCYQRDTDAARAVEKEAAALGGRATARQVDVTSAADVQAWVLGVEHETGPVDTVVTSAGVVRDAPLVMMSDEDWDQVLDTNLRGTFLVCRAAVFHMMKRKSGSVVNVSSIAGVAGNASQGNYSAAKAGIIGLSRSLAKEVGRYGIRVNTVAPGFIETDMLSQLTDGYRRRMLEQTPLRRFGEPEEVADAIAYLAGAGYVTGAVLQVDGGLAI
ncbi:3-oxoacyl-ACP reductase FabG [Streptomyces cocklensis]|uniref:3-oxoacyl-(Acyl-carrier-protein) reductase FabG n=1 Tax=Actinacidiphila cocklensis TaxID=887465 RepID=A0A9W4GNY6_9ACTN|nr:3-oxoacyl-ACP reductase FabG [Actinacidiphila cocklensis]MDD1063540.1 3-oxoacyl-ACP reductase FabG [Actinacidiphila cocklensis]WSX72930.1 3-oxoacyl-ACP reductase FabG [Streptomyces sp. NBC_00899]WSX81002.1 3-oxoacyl-ACP reductase FabG [Streptomyces sp. NBC_00899]CAG6391047.1 3-oxoacyl-(acyl-carrier-protein) reductase FabG [Actinacidiphila cocklensis]